ncbi:MAG: hypothetical protein SFU53_08150 [Terrimicrobiaceae bacterium]|nr:hypothetical protein [Terrimicrobiaceae bacterium]
MTTLFSEIQRLFERTYASVGINLEECLIDRRRSAQLEALAGAQARELSSLARTFLRAADGRLRVGIYYSQWLIEQLEANDPRAGLNDANIRALIPFVEEINHALHAAIRFRRGELPVPDEAYARNLELQAQVDTYLVLLLFVAFFRRPGKITRADRRWLRFHMFESQTGARYRDQGLRARYSETTHLAARYTKFLESLAATRRIEEIRTFHALGYDEKRTRILALPDRGRPSD